MELRPYQEESRAAVHAEWEKGNKRTLLVLPTGTGKTIVFAKITEDCVRTGSRVLIMAHRGELLQQASDKIKKSTGLSCAVEKAEESCLGSWYRVVVGSVQSLTREKRLFQFTGLIRGPTDLNHLCGASSGRTNSFTPSLIAPDIHFMIVMPFASVV